MLSSLRSIPAVWWLVVSTLAYIALCKLSWRIQGWTTGRAVRLRSAVQALAASPAAAAGSFAYNIAILYAALLLGVLDAWRLGLSGFDWENSLVVAGLMAITTGALLWLHSQYARQPSPALPHIAAHPSRVATVWRAAFNQAHLAFYRAVLAGLIGSYNGAFAALGLVVGEWALNPAWRAGWAHEPQQKAQSFDLVLALTTTVLFLYTGNLWVGFAVHAVLALALRVHYRPVSNPAAVPDLSR